MLSWVFLVQLTCLGVVKIGHREHIHGAAYIYESCSSQTRQPYAAHTCF